MIEPNAKNGSFIIVTENPLLGIKRTFCTAAVMFTFGRQADVLPGPLNVGF